jgi:hypothetical protein
LLLFGLIVLVFPDGALPSRVSRWLLWAYLAIYVFYVIATAVAAAGALAGHPVHVDASGGLTATDNPSGWYGTAQSLALAPATVLWLGFAARQVVSWRRSAGDRRQQLKWLAGGAALAIASAVLAITSFGLAWFGFAALPVAMGVAILRYRLYDIDRIISRTVSYAIVTGLLVGVYAGLVILVTQVLGVRTPVAVAVATLAAVALFNPLRRRVQRLVDRRFNRARYDAERTVVAFSARLRGAPDLDVVRGDLLDVVARSLQPAHASLWLRDGTP